MLTFLISCLIMLIFSDFAESSEIEGLRLYRSPDRTRIVLDLNEAVRYHTFILENPNRVVVDILDSRLNAAFEQLDLSNTPITRIRTGVRDSTDLRMVFDLADQVSSKVFSLQSNERYGNRLVVDLYDIKKRTTHRVVRLTV